MWFYSLAQHSHCIHMYSTCIDSIKSRIRSSHRCNTEVHTLSIIFFLSSFSNSSRFLTFFRIRFRFAGPGPLCIKMEARLIAWFIQKVFMRLASTINYGNPYMNGSTDVYFVSQIVTRPRSTPNNLVSHPCKLVVSASRTLLFSSLEVVPFAWSIILFAQNVATTVGR